MSEFEKNRHQRKKLVLRFCGPAKYLEEQCRQDKHSSMCLRKIMTPGGRKHFPGEKEKNPPFNQFFHHQQNGTFPWCTIPSEKWPWLAFTKGPGFRSSMKQLTQIQVIALVS